MCVQFKQPRKPYKAAKARNFVPLELVHSDLYEMNGELTKGGKRYFMTFIDDCTRFCYVYLLKWKYAALHDDVCNKIMNNVINTKMSKFLTYTTLSNEKWEWTSNSILDELVMLSLIGW